MVSSMGSRALVSLRPAIQATGRLAVAPVGLPRSVRKLIAWPGSGRAAVVSQQPAQPLAATHVGAPERADLWCDQLVAEPLMVPLPMVVRHELVDGAEQPTAPRRGRSRRVRSSIVSAAARTAASRAAAAVIARPRRPA